MATTHSRWDALDVLRGVTIIAMLLNLSPGSWEHNFGWLIHAKWEGWALIDMVAPAFLFCIGCAMPLSFTRRADQGATRGDLAVHVLWRGLLLVAIGFFLNLYPTFDFASVRIPGVLQRIGLCYALVGVLVVATARRQAMHSLVLRPRLLAAVAVFILVSYWVLLYFVPVPGFGAPRFDPVGSWPPVVDRAVIGVDHFFQYWPVDGQVVFDPEGILSTWPSCFSMLLGVLTGIAFARRQLASPLLPLIAGAVLMGAAYLLQGICPIIKNLWTSSFALFSGGFALAVLGLLMLLLSVRPLAGLFHPARIFGENPLLAYIIVFLVAPIIDANLFGSEGTPVSARSGGQAWLSSYMDPRWASLTFGLACMAVIFAVLVVCHRKRWILKL